MMITPNWAASRPEIMRPIGPQGMSARIQFRILVGLFRGAGSAKGASPAEPWSEEYPESVSSRVARLPLRKPPPPLFAATSATQNRSSIPSASRAPHARPRLIQILCSPGTRHVHEAILPYFDPGLGLDADLGPIPAPRLTPRVVWRNKGRVCEAVGQASEQAGRRHRSRRGLAHRHRRRAVLGKRARRSLRHHGPG